MKFLNVKQIEALVKKGKKETEAKIAEERALALKKKKLREMERAINKSLSSRKKKLKPKSNVSYSRFQNNDQIIVSQKCANESSIREKRQLREAMKHYEKIARARAAGNYESENKSSFAQAINEYIDNAQLSARYREIQDRAKEKKSGSIPISCMVKHGFHN